MTEGFVFAGLCSVINIATSASSAVGGWLYGLLNKTGSLYEWGWSWTGWLTQLGVSEYMVGLRPLILISAVFTLMTIVFIPLLKLDKKGFMKYGE